MSLLEEHSKRTKRGISHFCFIDTRRHVACEEPVLISCNAFGCVIIRVESPLGEIFTQHSLMRVWIAIKGIMFCWPFFGILFPIINKIAEVLFLTVRNQYSSISCGSKHCKEIKVSMFTEHLHGRKQTPHRNCIIIIKRPLINFRNQCWHLFLFFIQFDAWNYFKI